MKLSELGDLLCGPRARCQGEWKRTSFTSYPIDCSGHMRLRYNRQNGEIFWGCSTWPQCRHSIPFYITDLNLDLRKVLLGARKRRMPNDGR